MSVSLPRLTAGSVTAAFALVVLAAPTAALAAPGNEPANAGQARATEAQQAQQPAAGSAAGASAGRAATESSSDRGQASPPPQAQADQKDSEHPAPPAQAKGEPQRPAPAARGNSAEAGKGTADARKNEAADKKAADKKAADKKAKGAENGKGAEKAGKAKAAKPAESKGKSDESAKDGDPRGNNGTFKVDGPEFDTSHGNEPHVTCSFRLNFFGYDQGQLANISFTAVAPTKGGTKTISGTPVISTSPAKGGLYGGSYPASGGLTATDLGLGDGTTKLHIKVSVESINADGSDVPGGAKHKVFWLEPCAPVAPEAQVAPSVLEQVAPTTFVGPVAITETPLLQAATAPAPAAVVAAAPAAGVLGTSVTAQTFGAGQIVTLPAAAAQPALLPVGTASAPATLPFTGSGPLAGMLLGGIVALAGGAALAAAARRTA